MPHATVTFWPLLALLLSAPALAGDRYEEHRALSLDANGIRTVDIDVGAGALEVMGDESATDISLNAVLWIEDAPRDPERVRKALERHVEVGLLQLRRIALFGGDDELEEIAELDHGETRRSFRPSPANRPPPLPKTHNLVILSEGSCPSRRISSGSGERSDQDRPQKVGSTRAPSGDSSTPSRTRSLRMT